MKHRFDSLIEAFILFAVIALRYCAVQSNSCQAFDRIVWRLNNQTDIEIHCIKLPPVNNQCLGIKCYGIYAPALIPGKFRVGRIPFCLQLSIAQCLKTGPGLEVYVHAHNTTEHRLVNTSYRAFPVGDLKFPLSPIILIQPYLAVNVKRLSPSPVGLDRIRIGMVMEPYQTGKLLPLHEFLHAYDEVIVPNTTLTLPACTRRVAKTTPTPVTPCHKWTKWHLHSDKVKTKKACRNDLNCGINEECKKGRCVCKNGTYLKPRTDLCYATLPLKRCQKHSLSGARRPTCGVNEICGATGRCSCIERAVYDTSTRRCNTSTNPYRPLPVQPGTHTHEHGGGGGSSGGPSPVQPNRPATAQQQGNDNKQRTIIIACSSIAVVIVLAVIIIPVVVYWRRQRLRYADHDILLTNDEEIM
ncbi:uncharacterized protein LOC141914131 [Tubulanus polymorphus]|uniref:uncharacterized protein LOC141914131 n=1 Tax=Tubulanus polymorphus TaxID=672921 RepID=UPI003DA22953